MRRSLGLVHWGIIMNGDRLIGVSVVVICLLAAAGLAEAFPVSGGAWSEAQWVEHCKDVRMTYNRTAPLNIKTLTLCGGVALFRIRSSSKN